MPRKTVRIIKKSAAAPKRRGKSSEGPKARSRGELRQASGKARPAGIVCSNCGAIYFDKHWHSPELVALLGVDVSAAEERLCDECRISAKVEGGPSRLHEGEVVLEGLVDAEEKAEVLGLVRNVGKRAMLRDPQEHILRIEDKGGTLRVYTTENQLAISIGKQVDRARKGGTLVIKFMPGEKPVVVRWKKGI